MPPFYAGRKVEAFTGKPPVFDRQRVEAFIGPPQKFPMSFSEIKKPRGVASWSPGAEHASHYARWR